MSASPTDAPPPGDPERDATQASATIETLFAGDVALFESYRASSLRQFPHDIEAGARSVAQHDRPLLRRTAHNLKSVLAMLGDPAWSRFARGLEHDAVKDEVPWDDLAVRWAELAREVRRRAGLPPHP